MDQQGKLTAYVYKMQYGQCQKTLKFRDVDKYIDAGVTEYRAYASERVSMLRTSYEGEALAKIDAGDCTI